MDCQLDQVYGRSKCDRRDNGGSLCSKWERQGHNLFYVDNTAQVRGGLRGTLGEEWRADLVGVLVLNYSKTGGR